MRVISGPIALSTFRIQALQARLTAAGIPVAGVQTQFVHFIDLNVDSNVDLPPGQEEILINLLRYGADAGQQNGILDTDTPGAGAPDGLDGAVKIVIPRIGTISPWSSKATDIARSCGLTSVRRIERGTIYRIHVLVDQAVDQDHRPGHPSPG